MGLTAARRAPRDISVVFLLALTLVMVGSVIHLYTGFPVLFSDDAPILTSYREPATGELFWHDRLKIAPILYGLLHAVPAAVWSVGMPIQHSASLRRAYPALHRWSGRACLLSGLALNVTGLVLIYTKLSYSAPFWELHKWGPLRFPSFSLSTSVAGLIWPPLMLKTYLTARAKRWAEHRRYATYYTIVGYFITLFRLAIISLLAVGRALTLLPTLRQSLGVPELGTDGFEVEQAVFAFGMVVAYALAAMWYAWLFHMPSAQVSGAKKAV